MTVYVDDMFTVPMGQFGRMKMSHMIADTEEELHTMAQLIGVKRRWYQGDHYDVSIEKRILAIQNGAQAITMRELGRIVIARRLAAASGLSSPSEVQLPLPSSPEQS